MNIDFELIIQLAGLLFGFLSGVGVVPVVNWIKATFNLGARQTQLVLLATVVVYSMANMLVQGSITQESLTFSNFGVVLLAVFKSSQAEYQRIKNMELSS